MCDRIIFSFLLILLSSSVSAGKIYKWTDENGQIHFGAVPPNQIEVESTNKKTKSSDKSNNYNRYKPNKYVQKYKKIEREKEDKKRNEKYKAYDRKWKREAKKNNETRANAWKKKIVDACKAKRGVDCSSEKYLKSKLPKRKYY